MAVIDPTTELDAVNELLLSIGQAPVNTLAVTGIKDVNIARAMLLRITRTVLTRGFNFNTDDAYVLTPAIGGIILVPAGALKIDSDSPNIVVRRHATGLALYNKDDQTFVFTAATTVKVTWGFAYEDLPQTARAYIATAAGRRFQATVIGSPILDKFEEEDVQAAWILLEREERASRDTNLFRRNAVMSKYLNRRY